MPESQEKFYSANRKRYVLVADDEMINRELLGMVLQDEYEVLFAEDGRQALAQIKEYGETLSVILLDLMMPEMTGIELLEYLRADTELSQIPVIVLTSDQESEVKSLSLGAADFIQKPYPQPGVILARVRRTIELFEDRKTIRMTERDALTNLYNREYFSHYAGLFDQFHSELDMDAVVMDIHRFRIINERFGIASGDELLRRVGGRVREIAEKTGGIACRREADTFLIYCPHGQDYQAIIDKMSDDLFGGDGAVRIRLRMGVYESADKSLEIGLRFDRAMMALNAIRGNFTKNVEFFDQKLHEKELFESQLVEEFPQAVAEKQFRVFYQPKYDIRSERPKLAAAEALVRWYHPHFGMISPGIFIPLFEENGLIPLLDKYVWENAAGQISEWKKRFGISIPVSVNVSRVDMYDPSLLETFRQILDTCGITADELLLEVTESAYTEDSVQIIETVKKLRAMGFSIEMDDFGTGYSSLNMLSELPIDTLKLDMQFVRNAFGEKKDSRLLEIIIDIARYLNVPVIAEGVESAEQVAGLRKIGCEMVQGYFFSKPVPPEEFTPFIQTRIEQEQTAAEELPAEKSAGLSENTPEEPIREQPGEGVTFDGLAKALSQDYFSIYYVDIDTDRFIEYSSQRDYDSLGIEKSGEDFFGLSRKNIRRVVHPDDAEMFLMLFTKENILAESEQGRTFTLTYRLILENQPTYVHLKATRMGNGDDHHLVVGISSIDKQMLREEKHARTLRKANRDALTGVKSRYAFMEAAERYDAAISRQDVQPFAVAVCDLNGMREINETLGHMEGDRYIREACSSICHVFEHSPVYRIGGDDFAVVLSGGDYEIRADLYQKMLQLSEISGKANMIAVGITEYQPDRDQSFEEVVKRADAEMRANKSDLKRQHGDAGSGQFTV